MSLPSQPVLLAIALFLLALEHFGVPIPGWVTGVVLMILALLMLIGG